ncbi:MAG TPA: ABC transporter ATP-binding protein [Methylococcaceae bacterium]|jgi:iron(III) transport system ATP-binding protein|nr:ABC transporter ATP-binding protein [Methylococcaceae bacterium]
MSPRLELHRVDVAYGNETVVREISLQLGQGRIGCLLGPSGCGKTTLLRAIAGFEPVAQGVIRIDGVAVSSRESLSPPERREIGVVFQDYALFPHLSVRQNIAFGLHGLSRLDERSRVGEALELVNLRGVEDRYPHQLSGGQQQRVALARAIATRPRLLLVDEPFSNLDAELREHLAHELRRILKESGMTAVLVTHDQQEAFVMGDEIGVMAAGRLQQWADAETLYQSPANRFVANFIGHGTILAAVAKGNGLETVLGRLPWPEEAVGYREGQGLEILVRPNQIRLEPEAVGNARVIRKAFRGLDILYTLRLEDGLEVLSVTPTDSRFGVGDRLRASLDVHRPVVLPEAVV